MKVKVITTDPVKLYQPIELTFVLETADEARLWYNLFNYAPLIKIMQSDFYCDNVREEIRSLCPDLNTYNGVNSFGDVEKAFIEAKCKRS